MKAQSKIVALITAITLVFLSAAWLFAEEAGKTDAPAPIKININSATVDDLVKLKGIGPKHAANIVAYREQNGPFKNPEDITLVKGIGSKVYEMNKDAISTE